MKKKYIFLSIILILIAIAIIFLKYLYVKSNLKLVLNGDKEIIINVNEEYKDMGVKATYKNKDLSKKVVIKGKVNNKKIGTYKITYRVTNSNITLTLTRKIKVVDKEKPTINLKGSDLTIAVGNTYKEPGYEATDNYDGNLNDKVEVKNNIDNTKVGTYEVIYTVKDSSKNENSIKRTVNVIEKNMSQSIAVLNYHFFYDKATESCNDGNCEDVNDFKAQLNYLKENGYKTLSMKEFRDWMYGEIEIPDKSVLITIDDGAMGTGTHNGNKLIPILEEYKMHATLFLITGWWGIENYKSDYLDIESHTNDMHTASYCTGVTRGAQMLCYNHDQVLSDLKKSIEITNSKLAFCFPFYAYDDKSINTVKEAGFELAFIGGGYKVNRNTDKYHIPRYQITKTTSLETFIKDVS